MPDKQLQQTSLLNKPIPSSCDFCLRQLQLIYNFLVKRRRNGRLGKVNQPFHNIILEEKFVYIKQSDFPNFEIPHCHKTLDSTKPPWTHDKMYLGMVDS